MTRDNKIVILVSIGLFLIGFFFAFERDGVKNRERLAPEKSQSAASSEKKRAVSSSQESLPEESYAAFIKTLEGKLTSDDCARLFEDEFTSVQRKTSGVTFNEKMYLILEKWGEIAPKQALEKITVNENGRYGVIPVFKSWAKKNPEAAAAFFSESQDRLIGKNPGILSVISGEWAKHSPEKAWEWIQSQDKSKADFGEAIIDGEDYIVRAVADLPSEKALAFLNDLDPAILARNAYDLGEKAEQFSPNSDEWMKKLPENSRLQAEIGKMITQTKGDLEEIKKELSSFDAEKQKLFAQELSMPILDASRLDIKERIDWIMDTIPQESLPDTTNFFIKSYLLEDKGNAKKWVDSLPPGKKKERLLKYMEPPPRIIYQ